MIFKKFLLLGLLSLLITACSTKEYSKQESVFIVFKTPTLKYADLGFIYENSDEIKVEMYSSGQAIMSLEITSYTVCMSFLQCMGKKSFNKKVLNRYYPTTILDNIFKGKEIFSGKNSIKKRNGFTQKIVDEGKYDINYSVLNKQIIFRDTINNILIKMKRVGS